MTRFWEVWREGTVVNTRYGKIGAGGQTSIKDNPRVGMGDDHFETFITTVFKNDADARKMDRWFGRG